MSVETGPPAQPPQLSPDHKWIWDGTQWRPLAVHEAVFPTWQSVGAGLQPEAPAAPAVRIPTPPPVSRPAPYPAAPLVYRAAAPANPPGADVPLWRREAPSSGMYKYMYIAAGVIGLIILGVVLSSIGTIPLFWQQAPPSRAAASPTPPLNLRSDAARADRYANALLAPLMSDLNDSAAAAVQACAPGMTSSCEDALISTDDKVAATLTVVNRETVPLCIATPDAALRSDLPKVDADLQLALKAFKDNRIAELRGGLGPLGGDVAKTRADSSAIAAAAKACDTQPAGP